MGAVISTMSLFHYFLEGLDALPRILEEGLRPLSDFPESSRWQLIERELRGFYKDLYERWARPVLGRPYSSSGIFLTPIDFRQTGIAEMATRPRLRVPIERIDPSQAVLTYEWNASRQSRQLNEEELRRAAELWDPRAVAEWFGRDRDKLFYFIPQVIAYQSWIPVERSDLET